jgi:hypothetical protein
MRTFVFCVGIMLLVCTRAQSSPISNVEFKNISELDCNSLDSLLIDASEKQAIEDGAAEWRLSSPLRYLVDDDSFFLDYYTELERRGFTSPLVFDPVVKNLKAAIKSDVQIEYVRQLRMMFEANSAEMVKRFYSKSSSDVNKKYVQTANFCSLRGLATGKNAIALKELQRIVLQSEGKVKEASVGPFDIKINSCAVSDLPITKNAYTEPKQWEGSRFLVIDAVFKNQDVEGRLPSQGELIINYNGRELVYDTTETILQEGYGIYFKSINPLISMRTKIVYRIPNEVSGEVSWVPGRNTDRVRLWCTFVNGAKK